MNIYKLCELEIIDFRDTVKYCYLIHEIKITEQEFKEMCKEGLSIIEVQSMYCLREWLITHKGFRLLSIKGVFEFEKKCL